MTAFGGTAGVFFGMATLATVVKRDLSGLGKWLFAGALVIVVGAVINVFVGSTMGFLVISIAWPSASSACTCSTYLKQDHRRRREPTTSTPPR